MEDYLARKRAKIIAVGNPGSGKSTFLNALAEEILFKSGVSFGEGLTYQLDQGVNDKGHFLDTPGLADEKLRKAAGKAISEGLRKDGDYKVVFFVTQQAGRVLPQDATTMKLVLEAASEIGQNYGVVVNKVNKKIMSWSCPEASPSSCCAAGPLPFHFPC